MQWKIVGFLLMGSIPGSLVTLNYLESLDGLEQIEYLMNLTLGFSLVLTSIAVFLRGKIRDFAASLSDSPMTNRLRRWRPTITVVTGFALGAMVTLSSVGAGALGTALLIVLYPRLTMPAIVGTDLVHAVVLTSVAGAGHYQLGGVDLELLAFLLIGSLPGVFVGSHVGARLSPRVMQPIMGSLLMAIGLRFVLAA